MRKHWAREEQQVYFVTNTIVGWKNIFVTTRAIQLIIDSWKFFIDQKGAQFLAYTILPSHLHYIILMCNPAYGISSMQRDFKRYTARQIIKGLQGLLEKPHPLPLPLFNMSGFQREPAKLLLSHFREAGRIVNQTYRIWLADDQPKLIYTQEFFMQKLQYIHDNAVKAKIVERAEDYPYSSAGYYQTGKEGVIPIAPMRFS